MRSARKPLADELYLALRAAGLRVWKDDLEMDLDLAASMSEGIAKSEVVVMLVSPAYAASGPCMFEARATAAAGKPLVTCCAEPGFWRSWLAADGSGAPALTDDPELVALARLKTQLFVDLGEAAGVNWAGDTVPAAERKKLTLPEALPRLLALLAAARKAGAATATIDGADPASARASTVRAATSATRYTATTAVSTAGRASAASALLRESAVAPEPAPQPAPAPRLGPGPPAAPTPPPVWVRHRDGEDEWFVSASGEAAWELPEGAVAADAESALEPAQAAAPLVSEPEPAATEPELTHHALVDGAGGPARGHLDEPRSTGARRARSSSGHRASRA